MRYLITTTTHAPFLTDWYDFENHFNQDLGMIVYDLLNQKYTNNGYTWLEIIEDHL